MRSPTTPRPAALREPEPISLRDKLLLSTDELCQLTGLCDRTIRDLRAEGMPCVMIGRRPMYRAANVDAWLAQRPNVSTSSDDLAE